MPRLTADQWETIRAEREAGASFGDLSAKHGVDRAAICRRAKKEGWGDGHDVAEIVRNKVNAKVNGVDRLPSPAKRAAAIDAAADKAAEVIRRHQTEASAPRTLIYAAMVAVQDINRRLAVEDDPVKRKQLRDEKASMAEDVRIASIATHALAQLQAMERKSFSLDTASPATAAQAPVFYLPSNGR